MTKQEMKENYLQERYETLRKHYPYGVVVRQADGAIKFFNRDYRPLQEDFVKIPAALLKEVVAGADMNGSQHVNYDTYWYYSDGTAPANNVDERDYIWHMMQLGRKLLAYGFHPELYFEKEYKDAEIWTY